MTASTSVTKTPRLVYNRGSGLIILTDGVYQQTIARPDGMMLYLFWKKTREEIAVSLDHLVALMVQAGE